MNTQLKTPASPQLTQSRTVPLVFVGRPGPSSQLHRSGPFCPGALTPTYALTRVQTEELGHVTGPKEAFFSTTTKKTVTFKRGCPAAQSGLLRLLVHCLSSVGGRQASTWPGTIRLKREAPFCVSSFRRLRPRAGAATG